MTPETIARLRAESLSATLTATRHRRFRRRAVPVLITILAGGITSALLLPVRHTPAPVVMTASVAPPIPAVQHNFEIIHSAPGLVSRVTTRESSATLVRFSTDSTGRVPRIDAEGLSSYFPDRGTAIIKRQGEVARFVVF